MTYSYLSSDVNLWTVGSYDADDCWLPESDHDSIAEAAARVRFLNGGSIIKPDPKEPFAPTRFDRLLEAAFQGILANPEFAELSQTQVAEMSIQHTKVLTDLLLEQKL